MFGLFLFGFGTGLTVLSALGVPPWDVLHDGIRINTPLTFGQAAILVGFLLVAISFAFGIRPGVGTIANMLFVGVFIDLTLFIGEDWNVDDRALWLRAVVMVTGILPVSYTHLRAHE